MLGSTEVSWLYGKCPTWLCKHSGPKYTFSYAEKMFRSKQDFPHSLHVRILPSFNYISLVVGVVVKPVVQKTSPVSVLRNPCWWIWATLEDAEDQTQAVEDQCQPLLFDHSDHPVIIFIFMKRFKQSEGSLKNKFSYVYERMKSK